jgi:hypothetical protein
MNGARRPWRRCSACRGVCYWHDTAWVCAECGAEWHEEHAPRFAPPEETTETGRDNAPPVEEWADMPSHLCEYVEGWLTSNRKQPLEVRWGRYPHGVVGNLLERAEEAEQKLGNIRSSLTALATGGIGEVTFAEEVQDALDGAEA